ncbi:hypothetical protein C7E12_22065, partial [Stenotrophomonas maltophilia]
GAPKQRGDAFINKVLRQTSKAGEKLGKAAGKVAMSQRDDDRFRVRPGAPKQRGDAFINKVLRQTSKAGEKLGKAAGKV